jgi:hypothetical protein
MYVIFLLSIIVKITLIIPRLDALDFGYKESRPTTFERKRTEDTRQRLGILLDIRLVLSLLVLALLHS